MKNETLVFPQIKPCRECDFGKRLREVSVKRCRACAEVYKENPEWFTKDSCLHGGEDWVELLNVPSSTVSKREK